MTNFEEFQAFNMPKIKKRFMLYMVFGFFVVIILPQMVYNVMPGEKAIIYKRFGGGLQKDKVVDQGFHLKMPWDNKYIYDVRIQEDYEEMEVLDKNGLSIKIDMSYRFKPEEKMVGYLHDSIGFGFKERIIKPAVRSVTREVIGEYGAEELYSTKRKIIEDQIEGLTRENVTSYFIQLDAILIRDVTLPVTLQDAIEQKLKQEQAALEYEFKIKKETKEAERKRIEANGIAEFQRIVNKTITPQLLRWKGVEATQEIAKSNNTKVVIVGNGDDDLPIILSTE